MGFNELGLSDDVVHGVQSMGFVDPTPIQLRAIPVILSGKDLMGSAQTGTGKTAAFGLPILSKLGSHQKSPRCLVLEPTFAAEVLLRPTQESRRCLMKASARRFD